jgi:hypothetical protein
MRGDVRKEDHVDIVKEKPHQYCTTRRKCRGGNNLDRPVREAKPKQIRQIPGFVYQVEVDECGECRYSTNHSVGSDFKLANKGAVHVQFQRPFVTRHGAVSP